MNINSKDQNDPLTQQFRDSLVKPTGAAILPHSKQTFISKVERFQSQSSMNPGPGTYQAPLAQKHTIDFRSSKFKQPSIAVPKQHAWINGSGRLSYVQSNSSLSRLGPGQYSEAINAEGSHSNWAKCDRFNETKAFSHKLGPGSYDSQQLKQLAAPVSVFKSKAPRTFIQEMIEKNTRSISNQNSIKNPEEPEQKGEQIIKFEQTEYLVRKKVDNMNSVFASKSKRPDIINEHTSCRLGPGIYDKSNINIHTHTIKSPKSSIHYALMAPLQSTTSTQLNLLGPGTYKYQSVLDSQKFKKRQTLGFISKSQRFSYSLPAKKSSPGPGEYMQTRFTMIQQEDLRFKSKGSFARKPQKVHNFGIAARTTLRNKNNIPFGSYNLKNFDIQQKVEKQKKQYEKLKMMEVTLPAFNSKHHI